MEIKQLECLVACVNAGSFSKAGEMLYLNQSNISRTIQNLENELGVSIFLRSSKGLALTMEGERIYKKAQDILKSVNDLSGNAGRRILETFSVATFPSNYISYSYAKMCMRHQDEDVAFRLLAKGTSEILQLVESGGVDIGFIYCSKRQNYLDQILRKRNLAFTPISHACPCLYLGKGNPLSGRRHLNMEEIRSLKYMKVDYDYVENYYDLQETVKYYGLQNHLNHAYIIDGGYGMTQMLNNTDICYLGHAWVKPEGGMEIKNEEDATIYDRKCMLESHDGEIYVGYVLREGQEKTGFVWELLDILFSELMIPALEKEE